MPKIRETILQVRRRQITNRISAVNTTSDKARIRKELIAFDRKHGEAKTRSGRK